jgi:hypothetical protein
VHANFINALHTNECLHRGFYYRLLTNSNRRKMKRSLLEILHFFSVSANQRGLQDFLKGITIQNQSNTRISESINID